MAKDNEIKTEKVETVEPVELSGFYATCNISLTFKGEKVNIKIGDQIPKDLIFALPGESKNWYTSDKQQIGKLISAVRK